MPTCTSCAQVSNTFVNLAKSEWRRLPEYFQNCLQVEGQTDEELAFLLGHDSDPFCRWEAGQTLLRALLTKLYNAAKQQKVGPSSTSRA